MLKTVKIMTAIGITALICAAASAQESGWTDLFNGKDLSGWTGMNDVKFTVDPEKKELHLVEGMGWLRTDAMYDDFVLEFEAKPLVEGYDSGIFFRANLEGKPWPDKGYQVNLKDRGMGDLVVGYKAILKARMEPEDFGTWRKIVLRAEGPKANLQVDGASIWEKDDLEPGRGFIGIQAENREFLFRNVRIQELGYTNLLEGKGGEFKHLKVKEGDPQAWSLNDDGVLVCKGKGGGWIGTIDNNYSDFDLKLEFNAPKEGNSGVFIRHPGQGDGAYTGMEIQVIDDDATHWGKLQDWQMTGSIYHEYAPSVRAFRKADEWQNMEIVAEKNIVKIYLNGIEIVNADLDKEKPSDHPLKLRPLQGYLGFQNYDGAIQYRNVRVKRLAKPE